MAFGSREHSMQKGLKWGQRQQEQKKRTVKQAEEEGWRSEQAELFKRIFVALKKKWEFVKGDESWEYKADWVR
jgi:hypothetical protein